jgi:hypothetical protein
MRVEIQPNSVIADPCRYRYTGSKDSTVVRVLQVLVRERIRRILDPGTELWELCATAGLGLPYGDVSESLKYVNRNFFKITKAGCEVAVRVLR